MITAVTNILALTSTRALAESQQAIARAAERLATGKRINRASDDPAGMIASEKLTVEARQITEKIEAYKLETHQLGAKDGAMSVIGDMLLELSGLVVTAANRDGLGEAERQAMQIQVDGILDAIDFIGNTATFKGEKLLDAFTGNMGVVSRPSEDAEGNPTSERFSLASLRSGGALNLVSGDLELAQEVAKSAVSGNAAGRAGIGARINAIDSEVASLSLKFESVSAVKSQIMDADFAVEVSNLIRAQVLEQASLMMTTLAMSHQRESVMALLG